ncbi:hypothetical protein [Streptomyces sp. cmx-4-25]|uniref:hypothetical protein n=1 Tax=unclassified Streptomyces TaxID=2593676 RepID=UPI00397F2AEA
MTSEPARVLLVLPTARARYFGADKYATAWQIRNALRIAGKISPGAGVDVFLYGDPAVGFVEDGIAVRTRVEQDSLEQWIDEWAPTSGDGLGFLDDARPTGRVWKEFAVDGSSWFSRPRAAVREVIAELERTPGPTLVIFQIDSRLDQQEMVLAIRGAGEETAFWQLFGGENSVDGVFWTQDGLHRGRVLPNLAFSLGTDLNYRAVARRFSRWRKKTLG